MSRTRPYVYMLHILLFASLTLALYLPEQEQDGFPPELDRTEGDFGDLSSVNEIDGLGNVTDSAPDSVNSSDIFGISTNVSEDYRNYPGLNRTELSYAGCHVDNSTGIPVMKCTPLETSPSVEDGTLSVPNSTGKAFSSFDNATLSPQMLGILHKLFNDPVPVTYNTTGNTVTEITEINNNSLGILNGNKSAWKNPFLDAGLADGSTLDNVLQQPPAPVTDQSPSQSESIQNVMTTIGKFLGITTTSIPVIPWWLRNTQTTTTTDVSDNQQYTDEGVPVNGDFANPGYKDTTSVRSRSDWQSEEELNNRDSGGTTTSPYKDASKSFSVLQSQFPIQKSYRMSTRNPISDHANEAAEPSSTVVSTTSFENKNSVYRAHPVHGLIWEDKDYMLTVLVPVFCGIMGALAIVCVAYFWRFCRPCRPARKLSPANMTPKDRVMLLADSSDEEV